MKPFTTIAAAIFLLMAVVHAYRLIAEFPIVIGGAVIGQSISLVALVVTAILSFGLFREARASDVTRSRGE